MDMLTLLLCGLLIALMWAIVIPLIAQPYPYDDDL